MGHTHIRTYGTNYAHVSEYDCFVENRRPVMSEEEMSRLIHSVSDAESKAGLEKASSFMEP